MDKKNKISPIIGIFILGAVSGHHIDDLAEKYNTKIETQLSEVEIDLSLTKSLLIEAEIDLSETKSQLSTLQMKYNNAYRRYPIKIEHSLLENCISSYKEPLAVSYIRKKKNICICALDKAELDYDYTDFQSNEYRFMRVFKNKIDECM